MSSSASFFFLIASSVPLLSGNFETRRNAPNALTVGTDCTATSPCIVRFGNHVYAFVQGASASVQGGNGTAWVYVNATGQLTVGHNFNVTCGNGCVSVAGVTSFPADSIPLFTWQASNGSWVERGDDQRAALSAKIIETGSGLMAENDSSGKTTIRLDTTVIGLRGSVPASSTANCVVGSWAVDDSYYYVCVASNKWKRMAWSAW